MRARCSRAPGSRPRPDTRGARDKSEDKTTLLGFALLYVGAVLFLNGIWLMGHVGDREIAVINIFSGLVTGWLPGYLLLDGVL